MDTRPLARDSTNPEILIELEILQRDLACRTPVERPPTPIPRRRVLVDDYFPMTDDEDEVEEYQETKEEDAMAQDEKPKPKEVEMVQQQQNNLLNEWVGFIFESFQIFSQLSYNFFNIYALINLFVLILSLVK